MVPLGKPQALRVYIYILLNYTYKKKSGSKKQDYSTKLTACKMAVKVVKPLRRLSELKQWVESTRKALFPWKSKTASLKRLEVDDNDSGDFALFFVFFIFLGVVVFFLCLRLT